MSAYRDYLMHLPSYSLFAAYYSIASLMKFDSPSIYPIILKSDYFLAPYCCSISIVILSFELIISSFTILSMEPWSFFIYFDIFDVWDISSNLLYVWCRLVSRLQMLPTVPIDFPAHRILNPLFNIFLLFMMALSKELNLFFVTASELCHTLNFLNELIHTLLKKISERSHQFLNYINYNNLLYW
jgi:hypothetical protein